MKSLEFLRSYRIIKRDARTLKEIAATTGSMSASEQWGCIFITAYFLVLIALILSVISAAVNSSSQYITPLTAVCCLTGWVGLGVTYVLIVKKRTKKLAEQILDEAKRHLIDGLVTEENLADLTGHINSKGNVWAKEQLDLVLAGNTRIKYLIGKYGQDLASKIYGKQFFLGMTKDQLNDAQGRPDKIETAVLKTKTKETWIYGNKNSGDIFVFENELLVSFKDR